LKETPLEDKSDAAQNATVQESSTIGKRALWSLLLIAALCLEIEKELVQHSWFHALAIAILIVGILSTAFPMQLRRAFITLFGQIEYVQVSSPDLELRIRRRYQAEMEQLASLEFRLLFFEGQTFPILRLTTIFPAIVLAVMFLNREVITLHKGTRFLIAHPVFASGDRTTCAQALRLGVLFATQFDSGQVLISCNYGNDNLKWQNYVRHAYRGESIGATWAKHQDSVKLIESQATRADREPSFEKFINMVG
jgi:hypothetical protein